MSAFYIMPKPLTAPVKFLGRIAVVTMALATLGACANDVSQPLEGIGYRQDRFEQISKMREYRNCKDEGLKLDRKARSSGTGGTYLASARVLEKCETKLGPDTAGIAQTERMRAYALSIQNYFKGGNVEKARSNFDKFKTRYADHDLYYPDGTSFIVTMDALFGRKESWSFGELSALNVNDAFKREMRRVLYRKKK